jgi:hypothetical protein
MSSIFISYSSKQREFVEKLDQKLKALIKEHNQDIPIWWDHRLIGGEEWWETICEKIQKKSHFIFLISQESLESPFCQVELNWAKKLKRYVIPVKIDSKVPNNVINTEFDATQVFKPQSYNPDNMLNEVVNEIFDSVLKSDPVYLDRDELRKLIQEKPKRPLVNKELQKIMELIDNPDDMQEQGIQMMVLGYMLSMIKDPQKKWDALYFLQRISKMTHLPNEYISRIDELLENFETTDESKDELKPKSVKNEPSIDIHQAIELVKAVEPKSPEEYLALSDEILECFNQQNLDDDMLQEIASQLYIQYKQLTRQKLALELSRKNALLVKLISVENPQFGNLRGCLISQCIKFISNRNTFQVIPEFS